MPICPVSHKTPFKKTRGRSLARRALREGRQHEVLIRLLPEQAGGFARTGKVRHQRLAVCPLQKLDSQGGHRERRPPKLFAIRQGPDGMDVVAVVDGVELARTTVTVSTLGEEFVRGAAGTCKVADFPTPGEMVTLQWQEAQQNFLITGVE